MITEDLWHYMGKIRRDHGMRPVTVRPGLSRASEVEDGEPLRAPGLAVWCLVPPFAVGLRLFGTRRFIGRFLSLDDQPRWADQADGRFGSLFELLVQHRDELLLDALASIHEARGAEPVTVAVVYGAGHMPAVIHGMLDRYGYQPRGAEWLTIFDF